MKCPKCGNEGTLKGHSDPVYKFLCFDCYVECQQAEVWVTVLRAENAELRKKLDTAYGDRNEAESDYREANHKREEFESRLSAALEIIRKHGTINGMCVECGCRASWGMDGKKTYNCMPDCAIRKILGGDNAEDTDS